MIGRVYVNLSGAAGQEYAALAYREQEQEHQQEAARLYRVALQYDSQQASWWFNLGIAYQRLSEMDRALEAYEQAAALEPNDPRYRASRDSLRRWLAR